MARIKKVYLSGKIGNRIFYTVNGITYSRAIPKKVTQTEATKKSATQFKRANKISRALRVGLPDVFAPKDKEVMYRANTAVYAALRKVDDEFVITDIRPIEKLQFNKKATLGSRIRININVDWDNPGKVVITIPSFVPTESISAPATTRTLHWTITLTGFTVDKYSNHTCSHTFTTDISYNETAVQEQVLEIPYIIWPGNMYIVALNMQCDTSRYGKPVKVKDMVWLPSGVIGVCYRSKEVL
jgi:hypothetical protein